MRMPLGRLVLACALGAFFLTGSSQAQVIYYENFDSLGGADPQLEDGNGWAGSNTDSTTNGLHTAISAGPDRNVRLLTDNPTGFANIWSSSFSRPIVDSDVFDVSFNIDQYDFDQSQVAGFLTIGLRNGTNGGTTEWDSLQFGTTIVDPSNANTPQTNAGDPKNDRIIFRIQDYTDGLTNTTTPPSKTIVDTQYNVETLDEGTPASVKMSYDGGGNIRLQLFSGADGGGSVISDSGFVPINTASGSSLHYFSADRFFIMGDQNAGDNTRRVDLQADDFKVEVHTTAHVDNFEGFTPGNKIDAATPGNWTTAGTTAANESDSGLFADVRASGLRGTLYAFVRAESASNATYDSLGRARSEFGAVTENDIFTLTYDIFGMAGNNASGALGLGLQDGSGSDDGTRDGMIITMLDPGDASSVIFLVHDATSYDGSDAGNRGFKDNLLDASLTVDHGSFDRVQLTYDPTASDNLLLEILSGGSVIASEVGNYSVDDFQFNDLLFIQAQGTDTGNRFIQAGFDNITVQQQALAMAVPEPSTGTVFFLLLGMATLFGMRRRPAGN